MLKDFIEIILEGLSKLGLDWDRKSYSALLNCLTLEDDLAVKTALDQLVLESKPFSIPPIYLCSRMHPNRLVRQHSLKALARLGFQESQENLQGLSLKSAIENLIQKYGHFRDSL